MSNVEKVAEIISRWIKKDSSEIVVYLKELNYSDKVNNIDRKTFERNETDYVTTAIQLLKENGYIMKQVKTKSSNGEKDEHIASTNRDYLKYIK